MANRYGPLGLDRPHNLKVDGFYLFDLKKAGQLITGAQLPRAVGHRAQRARRAPDLRQRRVVPPAARRDRSARR